MSRSDWQIAQAARCGCGGSDDLCACQNENAPWRYGLALPPKPPFGRIRSPMRDYHEVIYSFSTSGAARAFKDHVERRWTPDPLPAGGVGRDPRPRSVASETTVCPQILPSDAQSVRPDGGEA